MLSLDTSQSPIMHLTKHETPTGQQITGGILTHKVVGDIHDKLVKVKVAALPSWSKGIGCDFRRRCSRCGRCLSRSGGRCLSSCRSACRSGRQRRVGGFFHRFVKDIERACSSAAASGIVHHTGIVISVHVTQDIVVIAIVEIAFALFMILQGIGTRELACTTSGCMIAVAFLLVGNVAIEHDFRNDGFGTNGVGLCHTHHDLASVIGSGSYRSRQDHHPSSQRDEKHAAHHGEQKSVSKLSANNAFCAQEERLSVNGYPRLKKAKRWNDLLLFLISGSCSCIDSED